MPSGPDVFTAIHRQRVTDAKMLDNPVQHRPSQNDSPGRDLKLPVERPWTRCAVDWPDRFSPSASPLFARVDETGRIDSWGAVLSRPVRFCAVRFLARG